MSLAPSQGGDAVGAAARHRSVGPLRTPPPRRSEAPNQGRLIRAAASHRRCISRRPAPLLGVAHDNRRRFRRRCLFCARLRTDSGYCTATRCARAIYRGDTGVDERGLAFRDLAGYRLHNFGTPRLPERCVSRQIIHRDVRGLNFLLKEMSGYFETCICDFGAPSTSSAHGRWRCLGRSCRGRRCARREPRGHRVQDGLQGNPRLHVARAARGGYPLGTAAASA